MLAVVAGLSKNIIGVVTFVVTPASKLPTETLARLLAASPIAIAVLPRIKRPCKEAVPLAPCPVSITKTKILLVALDGVMVADKPVTSVKEVLVVVKVSLLAVLTTCRILAFAKSVASMASPKASIAVAPSLT